MPDPFTRTRYRIAQHWRYGCDTPEARDTLVIQAVEDHPRLGVVLLVWIEYEAPFHISRSNITGLPWMWFTQDAIDRSVTELIEEQGPLCPNLSPAGELSGHTPSCWVIETRSVGELVEEWTAVHRRQREEWKEPEPDTLPVESMGLWTLIARGEVGVVRERLEKHPTLVNDPLPIDEDDEYCFAVSEPELDDCSPLALAAYLGQGEVARLLLDLGADVNRADRNGDTPLHYAGRSHERSDDDVARLLCERGADPNARNHAGLTPMTCGYCTDAVAAVLHELGAPLTLNHAIRLRKVDEARRILRENPNAVRDTAFPRAVIDDVIRLVHDESERRHGREVRLARGEVPAPDEDGWPDRMACRVGKRCRDDDPDEKLAEMYRHAEIQRAVFDEYRDLLEAALTQGADPNGTSVLFYAVQYGYDTSVVELLLERGADPVKYDSEGTYLSDLAQTRRMINLLKRYGGRENPHTRKRDRWEIERDELFHGLRDRFV